MYTLGVDTHLVNLLLWYMGKREIEDENDDNDILELRDEDIANLALDADRVVRRDVYLTNDVTQADLSKYPDHQLAGRLAYYERQYTFENSKKLRFQFRCEVERTRIEIKKRAMYARKEADRVFEL